MHGRGAMSTEQKVKELNTRMDRMEIAMGTFAAQVEESKQQFLDMVQLEFTQRKVELETVVNDARGEFVRVREAMQAIFEKLDTDVGELKKRVEGMEHNGGHGEPAKGGLVDYKDMKPEVFDRSQESWRNRAEKLTDYLDARVRGVREVLTRVVRGGEKRRLMTPGSRSSKIW